MTSKTKINQNATRRMRADGHRIKSTFYAPDWVSEAGVVAAETGAAGESAFMTSIKSGTS